MIGATNPLATSQTVNLTLGSFRGERQER